MHFKNYINIFKDPNFLKIFISSNLLNFAQSLVNITIIWLVYNQTNSAIFIAIAVTSMQLPGVLLAPFLGIIVDRFSTKLVASISLLTKSILFVCLGFLINSNNNVLLFLFLGINSLTGPIIDSCINVLIKELFDNEKLIITNSLMTVSFDLAYIFGTLASGLVVITGKSKITFVAIAVIFILISWILNSIRHDTISKPQISLSFTKSIQHMSTSLKFLWQQRPLFNVIIVSFLWNLLIWGSLPVILPIFSKFFKRSILIYSSFNSIQSIGIIIGSLFAGMLTVKFDKVKIIYLSIVSQSLFLMIFSLQKNALLALSLFLLAGICSAPCMIYKTTYLQECIPENRRGQVFLLNSTLSTVSYPIGNFLTALLSKKLTNHIGIILFVFSIFLIIFCIFLYYNGIKFSLSQKR
ncbi:MFS transporter [Lactobacillus salivarius]|uniref:MFS transporter n=1 Tax=Ligilactobacillus salivarius TaxID=1624 RepID=A0A6A8LPM4_9LACO|nr:MFS transporter [Ligilactobacillus salivarius]MSE07410.1 MFS transporter [Ligilactobacillus salivarius]